MAKTKKYRVGLVQTVTEEATLYIEAGSFEEAERLAFEQANAGTVEWRFLDAFEPVEIVTLDEEAEPPKSPEPKLPDAGEDRA